MGVAARRARYVADQIAAYVASIDGISCPSCGAAELEVVDLLTGIPLFHEPDMPPGPRFLCGRCLTEWERSDGLGQLRD